MADDLSSAPLGGGEVATPADAGTSAPATESKAPSAREAIEMAMTHVETRAPTETEKAAAVLKDGPGADDRLSEAAKKAADDLQAKDPAASERAKKGWETRRENAAKPEVVDPAVAAKADPKAADPKAEPAKVETAPVVESKFKEPPKGLLHTTAAKAAWEQVPEPVREDLDRRYHELEQGITKNKESADKYAELAEFEQMAKDAYGLPLKDVMKNYAALDKALSEDFVGGLEKLVRQSPWGQKGGTLRQLAEHIVSQEPEENNEHLTEVRREIADMKRENAELRKQLEGVSTSVTTRQQQDQEQRQASVQTQVDAFAKEHPRFDELADHVFKLLKSDLIDRTGDLTSQLKQAYETAEKLNPAPSLSPPAPAIPAPDRAAQTRAGQASVSGAPGSGSNPAVKKPAPSNSRDAISQAFSKLGIAQPT